MNLTAPHFEGFKSYQRVAHAVGVSSVAEIQPQQHNAIFFINSSNIGDDAGMYCNVLGIHATVFAPTSRAGSYHTIFYTVSSCGEGVPPSVKLPMRKPSG